LQLTDLIDEATMTLSPGSSSAARSLEIRGLSADSRTVAPGFLFAALPGARSDGRAFIADALARGAVAVLAPAGTSLEPRKPPVALVIDDNPRRALARLAARFSGRQPRTCVAVTGTNGKTSVVEFTRQIWAAQGLPATSLGTLGARPADPRAPGGMTTPDPVALHAFLAGLAEDGVQHLALEASSHGLDQFRLDGLELAAAAFTNLTQDHLDYHGTLEAYLAAKLRLFAELLPAGATAVVNADGDAAERVVAACTARGLGLLRYGRSGRELRLLKREATPAGQRLRVELLGTVHDLVLPLVGHFQAGNALAALGLALASGTPAEAGLAALEGLEGVPGRVELVGETAAGGRVYVDYAHTPDALDTVLTALRPHTRGQLVVVFGCGGDRDRGKRPLMGAIAARRADRAIVTDDNPRSEDPAAIRRAVLAAAPEAIEIGDRGEAIAVAVAALGSGDTLVIAGKGHESGQTVGETVLPFDDREVARAHVARSPGGRAAP